MNQTPGSHPSSANFTGSSISRLFGYILADIEGFFIATNDGIFIDLGSSTGDGDHPGLSVQTGGSIPSTSLGIGQGIGSGTFTPGDMV